MRVVLLYPTLNYNNKAAPIRKKPRIFRLQINFYGVVFAFRKWVALKKENYCFLDFLNKNQQPHTLFKFQSDILGL